MAFKAKSMKMERHAQGVFDSGGGFQGISGSAFDIQQKAHVESSNEENVFRTLP